MYINTVGRGRSHSAIHFLMRKTKDIIEKNKVRANIVNMCHCWEFCKIFFYEGREKQPTDSKRNLRKSCAWRLKGKSEN